MRASWQSRCRAASKPVVLRCTDVCDVITTHEAWGADFEGAETFRILLPPALKRNAARCYKQLRCEDGGVDDDGHGYELADKYHSRLDDHHLDKRIITVTFFRQCNARIWVLKSPVLMLDKKRSCFKKHGLVAADVLRGFVLPQGPACKLVFPQANSKTPTA